MPQAAWLRLHDVHAHVKKARGAEKEHLCAIYPPLDAAHRRHSCRPRVATEQAGVWGRPTQRRSPLAGAQRHDLLQAGLAEEAEGAREVRHLRQNDHEGTVSCGAHTEHLVLWGLAEEAEGAREVRHLPKGHEAAVKRGALVRCQEEPATGLPPTLEGQDAPGVATELVRQRQTAHS